MSNTIMANDHSYTSHYVDVFESKMHFIEQGKGDPILFLHGIPTSSFVWRNVIPHLSTIGRCIAVDLIGFGKSDKPNIEYTFLDHIKYVSAFIEKLKLKNITFVMHGWGSLFGFYYAMKHPSNCKGLVFYEAYIRAVSHDDFALPMQEQLYISENNTTDCIKDASNFVDKIILQNMTRPLTDQEINAYRQPFLTGSDKPLRTYLRELPLNKNNTNQFIEIYSIFLRQSNIPKLMLYSVPGFITTISTVMWAKENFTNLEVIEIGEALHFAQENNPFMMGEAISVWLQGIEQSQQRI